MAGYSQTPLIKKLGIAEGHRVMLTATPDHYFDLIEPLPDNVTFSTRFRRDIDVWHYFSKSASELKRRLPEMRKRIRQDGMIWVSWPKKASGVVTDITEDVIRHVAIPLGLVDVKVCAVDDVWSGLKLVIRKELRK